VHKGMKRHRSYLSVKSTSVLVLVNVKQSKFVGVLFRDKTQTRYKNKQAHSSLQGIVIMEFN
jgi:hypothetical protein